MNKFLLLNTNPQNKYRIICICHAGGYSAQYLKWQTLLPKEIECVVYERPGNGSRFGEDFYSDWHSLLSELVESVRPYLDRPYVLYGHSLGGSIAFELIRKLEYHGLNLPLGLFVGDRKSPSITEKLNYHNLPDDKLLQVLINEYGLSEAVAANSDIMGLFLPIIRNDFLLVDEYSNYAEPMAKINTPLVVFRSLKSKDPLHYFTSWENHTWQTITLTDVSGGHFFPFEDDSSFLVRILESFKERR